jgi:hypothetical protein
MASSAGQSACESNKFPMTRAASAQRFSPVPEQTAHGANQSKGKAAADGLAMRLMPYLGSTLNVLCGHVSSPGPSRRCPVEELSPGRRGMEVVFKLRRREGGKPPRNGFIDGIAPPHPGGPDRVLPA